MVHTSYFVSHFRPNSVNFAHYKPKDTEPFSTHLSTGTVQQSDDDRLNNDWRAQVTIFDTEEKHRPPFLQLLEKLKEMWDGRTCTDNKLTEAIKTNLWRYPTCTKCTLLSPTNWYTICSKRSLLHAEIRHHQTCNNRENKINSLRTERARFDPSLCRLSEIERRNCQILLSISTNGRVCRLIRISARLLNLRYTLQLRESWNRQTRLRKDLLHRPLWHVQIFRMLLGLKSAPAVFRWAIEATLFSVKELLALVGLDNIVFFLKTVEEHLHHPSRFLTLLRDADVALELEKYAFFAKDNNYFRLVIHLAKPDIAETTKKAML